MYALRQRTGFGRPLTELLARAPVSAGLIETDSPLRPNPRHPAAQDAE